MSRRGLVSLVRLACLTCLGVPSMAHARLSAVFERLAQQGVSLRVGATPVPSPADEAALRRAVAAQNAAVANTALGELGALNPRAVAIDEALAFFEHLSEADAAALAGRTLDLDSPDLHLRAMDGFGVRGLGKPWRLALGPGEAVRIEPAADADDLHAEWAAAEAGELRRQDELAATERTLSATHEDDDAYGERFRARASARAALAMVQSVRLGVAQRLAGSGGAVPANLEAEIARLRKAVSKGPAPGGMR